MGDMPKSAWRRSVRMYRSGALVSPITVELKARVSSVCSHANSGSSGSSHIESHVCSATRMESQNDEASGVSDGGGEPVARIRPVAMASNTRCPCPVGTDNEAPATSRVSPSNAGR